MPLASLGAPWSRPLNGRLDELIIESEALRQNHLGDPHIRPLYVYVPPGYDASQDRLPSVYFLQGLTGQVDMWRNRSSMRSTVIELFDELFSADDAPPPCIVVFPDCWTSLGGSQYLDSPGTGRYHTYLCDEVVPFVDARYRTLAAREHRGVAGKSSGGYGAMVTRCSGQTSSGRWRRTPVIRSSSAPTRSSFPLSCVHCAITTAARTKRSGWTSAVA